MRTLTTIFITCLLTSLVVGTLEAQWVQTNGPYGGEIQCFAVVGVNFFAGTFGDGIFLSTDNGSRWTAVNSGLANNYVRSIAVSRNEWGSTILFAGTDVGVFLSNSLGLSWAQVNSGLTSPFVNTLIVSGTDLFAGTSGGGVFLSTDNGTNWIAVNSGLTSLFVRRLAISGGNLFAGTDDGVFRSTDNGTSWSAAGTPFSSFSSMVQVDSDLFAGTDSGIFRSPDSGLTWSSLNNGLRNLRITAIAIDPDESNPTNIYASSTSGRIYRTSNGGVNWEAINSGLMDLDINALVVNYPGSPYLHGDLFAGTRGGIFRSTDRGVNWTTASRGLPVLNVHSFAQSGTKLFAATEFGGVFCSSDNGTYWKAVNNGLGHSRVAALARSGTNLFAGTYAGVYRSSDNGLSWTAVNSGLTDLIIRQLATIGNTIFVGTHHNMFFRSTDNGSNWTQIRFWGTPGENIEFLVVDGSNIFAGSQSNGVYLSTDYGTTWATFGRPNYEIRSLVINGKKLFMGTDYGIYRSTNNGSSWTEVNNGLCVSPCMAIVPHFAAFGTNIFAAVTYHGISLSTNSGNDWTPVNAGMPQDHLGNYPSPRCFAISDEFLFAAWDNTAWRRPLSEMVLNPVITSVEDVMADQGGKVTLNWASTRIDTNTVTCPYYSIWRSISPSRLSSLEHQPNATSSRTIDGVTYRYTSVDGNTFAWELIGRQDAHRLERYSYTASTLYDSMQAIDGRHNFLVSAHTNETNIFYDSNIGSGYSVDNLAPIPPSGLRANEQVGGGVRLSWDPPTDTDIGHYDIYRYTSNSSTFHPSKIIGTSTLPWFTDINPIIGTNNHYHVVAIDIHGNESLPSAEGTPLPTVFTLYQNYPNPFNPVTVISYSIPAKQQVRLSIYNSLGQEVDLLKNSVEEPGYQSVTFDGSKLSSGVYYSRLQAGSYVETKKLLLLK